MPVPRSLNRSLLAMAGLSALSATACQEATAPSHGATAVVDPVVPIAIATLPFAATYTITPGLLFPGDAGYPARCPTGPTNAASPATGQGHATHLGTVTETESSCIDFATLALTLGEFAFTGPDGDKIFGTFEGSASFDPPPPNADLFCTWEITGGTGRFEGATGAGNCVDSHQLGNGQSLIKFSGWISYDASKFTESHR